MEQENNNNSENFSDSSSDMSVSDGKSKAKIWILSILALVIVAAVLFGVFRIRGLVHDAEQGKQAMAQAEQYAAIMTDIRSERERCNTFISVGQGDFSEFGYCQKFLLWSEGFVQ